MKVLLVENHIMSAAMLCATLRLRPDVVVTETANAELALQTLMDEGPYVVILIDVEMKGMGGLALMRAVREVEASRQWSPEYIVGMSVDPIHEPACMQSGANAFIDKRSKLVRTLLELIDSQIEETP